MIIFDWKFAILFFKDVLRNTEKQFKYKSINNSNQIQNTASTAKPGIKLQLGVYDESDKKFFQNN